jgi:ABC-type sulfate/molybdate transport systems ATPase subunit
VSLASNHTSNRLSSLLLLLAVQVVGSSASRKLSGGQRNRVTMGLELAG